MFWTEYRLILNSFILNIRIWLCSSARARVFDLELRFLLKIFEFDSKFKTKLEACYLLTLCPNWTTEQLILSILYYIFSCSRVIPTLMSLVLNFTKFNVRLFYTIKLEMIIPCAVEYEFTLQHLICTNSSKMKNGLLDARIIVQVKWIYCWRLQITTWYTPSQHFLWKWHCKTEEQKKKSETNLMRKNIKIRAVY